MFIRNNWYVASFAADLPSGQSVGRNYCGEAVVLFRDASGRAAALEDRCIHRGMPLSGGKCAGATIQCLYHGIEFDASGACTRIPGQDQIPPAMRVKTYPLVERDGLLWIWMGDAAKADPSRIVSYPYHSDPKWIWTHFTLEFNANWELLNDNLLDLTHIRFVHAKVAEKEEVYADEKFERIGNTVQLTRLIDNAHPSAFYAAAFPFKGKIDHYWKVEFMPGLFRFSTGGVHAGSGHDESTPDSGVHMRHLHCITPLTADRTQYAFSVAHNFRLDDEKLTKHLHDVSLSVLLEDKVVLERQYRRLLETPDRPLVAKRSDEGLMHGRRIVRELIDLESEGARSVRAA